MITMGIIVRHWQTLIVFGMAVPNRLIPSTNKSFASITLNATINTVWAARHRSNRRLRYETIYSVCSLMLRIQVKIIM